MSILAVGDIHGYMAELARVLSLADDLRGPDARIVFLGDLIDRGPDSRGVIETLMRGIEAGRDWIVLRGNHDQMFLDFLDDASTGDPARKLSAAWLDGNNGGAETLRSYAAGASLERGDWAAAARAVPPAHVRFLESLPFCFQTEEQFFVHAGIRPGVALGDQTPEDMLWIRREFHDDRRDHGKLIVHGHTPVDTPTHYGNRVNLDTGAGWGRPLELVEFEGCEARRLTPAGPRPVSRARV